MKLMTKSKQSQSNQTLILFILWIQCCLFGGVAWSQYMADLTRIRNFLSRYYLDKMHDRCARASKI